MSKKSEIIYALKEPESVTKYTVSFSPADPLNFTNLVAYLDEMNNQPKTEFVKTNYLGCKRKFNFD